MHGIYVKEGQYSQHRGTPFCAMAFHLVMLLVIAIMQLSKQNLYDTPLESSIHGESEYSRALIITPCLITQPCYSHQISLG